MITRSGFSRLSQTAISRSFISTARISLHICHQGCPLQPQVLQRLPSSNLNIYRRHLSYSSSPYVQSPSKFWTRRKLFFAGIVSIATLAYIVFPSHKYPAEVADLIRQGLYAERKESDPDRYATALDFFLAALEVADKLGMEKISPEYTGLQIKAASMLELMGSETQAFGIYKQMLQFGTEWAVSNSRLWTIWPSAQMLTYLRVCVRGLELSEQVNDKVEMLHYTAVWIDLMQGGLPESYHSILKTRATTWIRDLQQTQGWSAQLTDPTDGSTLDFNALGELKIADESYTLPLFPTKDEITQFQKWRVNDDLDDTLLLARDFFATVCIELMLPNIGLEIKKENIRMMQMFDLPLPRILRTEVDICSGYYVAYELSTVSEDPQKRSHGPKLLAISQECYKSVLATIQEIRNSSTERINYTPEDYEDLEVSNSLAVYGLGVIEAKQKNYPEAMRLFKEARSRALGAQLPELVEKLKEEWDELIAEMTADQFTNRDTLADAAQYLGSINDLPNSSQA
ncbi:uncharacterized protein V2V93DRAFT_369317 [Kockiozyma suomiensis]|uniref:uncharacterized protein n=1 Tax=Kockiozyma suomiensis TaxID=1337062 RepID=UPI003344022A